MFSRSDPSIFDVACRSTASGKSSLSIPDPSSTTRISDFPPCENSVSIREAPASIAFSINSLTTDAGRSMTSPAAIRLIAASVRRFMRSWGPPPPGVVSVRMFTGRHAGAATLLRGPFYAGRLADDYEMQLVRQIHPPRDLIHFFKRQCHDHVVAVVHVINRKVIELHARQNSGD